MRSGKHSFQRCQYSVGGWPLQPGGDFLPPLRKEGVSMLTFSDLFQFCMVIIGIVGLVIQILNKKK